MIRLRAVGASGGVAIGPAVVIGSGAVEVPEVANPAQAFQDAVAQVAAKLTMLAENALRVGRTEASEVLAAQALMAEDPMLSDAVMGGLDSGLGLAEAIDRAVSEIEAMFAAIDDPYIAARVTDAVEVADRVRRVLAGASETDLSEITEPSVMIAATITAAETAQLDAEVILGFATEAGGPTSHVAIIARSLGVPAVVGATGVVTSVRDGITVALDGGSGEIAIAPDDNALSMFESRRVQHRAEISAAARFKGRQVSVGGTTISVAANVGNTADLKRAVDEQADGIGLFRTEFLYLDRASAPSEDEQAEIYESAARSFGVPVVVRAFDIGGDKPSVYISTPTEENPFLGVRGARLYGIERELFEAQVRAVARAGAHGDVWLMLPMISTVAEIVEIRGVVDRVVNRLAESGVSHGRPPLGIMIEVPSVALIADSVVNHVDFVSIGTNDLTQYTLAADRTNGALDHLQDPLHPSVLALCMMTAAAARRAGISVSVCGLAAADPVGAVLFAGMGIDKLSVSTAQVNRIKAVLDRVDPIRLNDMVQAALAAPDAASVRAAVADLVEMNSEDGAVADDDIAQ